MIGTALLLLLAAQSQAQQQQPLRQEGPSDWAEPVADTYNLPNGPAARETIQRYGECVVKASPDKASKLLAMDFTSSSYRSGLRSLALNNSGCFGRRGKMRASNLMFAASVSEALLARDASPLNARLARAASGPSAPTYSPSDAAAMCTVRSAPDDVSALLNAAVASEAEKAAAVPVAAVFARCAQGGKAVSTTVEGLRAIMATAAFRSINSGVTPVTDK